MQTSEFKNSFCRRMWLYDISINRKDYAPIPLNEEGTLSEEKSFTLDVLSKIKKTLFLFILCLCIALISLYRGEPPPDNINIASRRYTGKKQAESVKSTTQSPSSSPSMSVTNAPQTSLKTSPQQSKPSAQNRVCINQYDTRPQNILMKLTESLCKRTDGCKYIYQSYPATEYPIYWMKVWTTLQLLKSNPECKVFMWLDSDAYIMDMDYVLGLLESEEYEDRSMIVSRDVPPWTYGLFNAGVWFVRNDFRGHFILDSWMGTYDAEHWYMDPISNTWATDGSWAGDTYEQGAFHKILDANFLKRYVQYIGSGIIQNTELGCNQGKVKHFPGSLKERRHQFVQKCLAADLERWEMTESEANT